MFLARKLAKEQLLDRLLHEAEVNAWKCGPQEVSILTWSFATLSKWCCLRP